MIPIRDTVSSKNYPVVNIALISINVIVFILQMSRGAGADHFVYTYGLVPARYIAPDVSSPFTFIPLFFSLISFMFLHGGFFHLIGNMWSLYIFGDNVEDRLGPVYYLMFYLLAGLISGLCHVLLNPHSTVPTIGASGAVAGVMGAYFILYPHSKILTLIPIVFIPWFVEIPAIFFLGLWFVMQLLNAYSSIGLTTGIAWWAHIGGFVFGVACIKLLHIPHGPDFREVSQKPSVKRKTSPHFQIINPSGKGQEDLLAGEIRITPFEAAAGTKKTINIPLGFHNRFYRVMIPSGAKDGTILRLRGIGRQMPDGQKEDLFLRVKVEQPW
ncbi:MAG: rhomboid family intramembrane serine protease [Desulfobacteraceae bacterium]|nr:MAG: rhomboid family intramembrane serine protease [Desulfobacteraceae bacterium]